MTSLAPRVYARVGIPEAPGRARLLSFPRPVTSRPAVRSPVSEAVAGAAFWLLCGALIAGSLTYESMRVPLDEARKTAERLDANGRYLACEYVRAAQVVLQAPGFEAFVAQAEILGEQLAPEVRAACRGVR